MSCDDIRPMDMERLARYAEIYALAFSGEPWHDAWEVDDAATHVRELMESRQSYGLEYVVDGEVAGFVLGTSMLFHDGRTFEVNDLAVHPNHQGRGIASALLERCVANVREQGMVGVRLITAAEGALPSFYKRHGFTREDGVTLMGIALE